MDSLYQENILEHYKHPHNRRQMVDADVVQKGFNASCGDDLVIYLKWKDHRADDSELEDISFEGFGCAISQSGASMLTDKIKGWKKSGMRTLSQKDMYELYGMEISAQRQKCGMLALSTLLEAIEQKPRPRY